MGIWEKLLEAEQNIRKRVENAFGHETSETLLQVRRDILEQVAAKVTTDASGKDFPFGKVMVWLQPPTGVLHEVFETAFLQDDSLKADILQSLEDTHTQHPEGIEIIVTLEQGSNLNQTESSPHPMFRLDFVKPAPVYEQEIPEIYLVISEGAAERPAYRMRKDRILIGRLSEVLDREGRMVRMNDVAFLDNGDDINSTVGRTHARIWFDPEKQEFRIMDEVSRHGTRIVREGRSIEVPGASTHGIGLRSGDEIYCGQACIRFKWTSTKLSQ
jgi:hypothetical protein